MESVLLDILRLGAVGLVAALFSSFISNRDHRARAWWAMRVAAYQGVIEALSDLVYYYDQHFRAELKSHELSEEQSKALEAWWAPAFHRIRKAADSGAFLFTTEANVALQRFLQVRDEEKDTFVDAMLDNLEAASECLTQMVALSKTDLQLPTSWWAR